MGWISSDIETFNSEDAVYENWWSTKDELPSRTADDNHLEFGGTVETKKEAELFFKFFMGLWDEMFRLVELNQVSLPRISPKDDLIRVCGLRYDMLEQGFIEGFWGGSAQLKIPAYVAQIVDSITELATVYRTLEQKVKPQQDNKAIFEAIIACDKTAVKSISFVIEQYALPHMEALKHSTDKGN
jgi:hypothetical protein